MHAVLAIDPLEAMDLEVDRHPDIAVLFVGQEHEAVAFLEAYALRHKAACSEWRDWDKDLHEDWGAIHDEKLAELCEKYQINNTIDDVEFRIVPVG
jgi:hypothetical protein